MEEIIHAFGINWRLIGIQMFNFAILAVALWYFLYTPILNIIATREAKLKQGVEDAEAAAAARASADAEKHTVLTTAQAEASAIVARAAEHAEKRGEALMTEFEAKAARTLENAEAQALEIKARAQKESEAEVAATAILATEKLLRERLDR